MANLHRLLPLLSSIDSSVTYSFPIMLSSVDNTAMYYLQLIALCHDTLIAIDIAI